MVPQNKKHCFINVRNANNAENKILNHILIHLFQLVYLELSNPEKYLPYKEFL